MLLVLMGLGISTNLWAQGGKSQVLPAGGGIQGSLEKTEGNSSLFLPAGRSPARVQLIYRGRDLNFPKKAMIIRSLSFRRDGSKPGVFPAHTWKVGLVLSSDGVPLPSESSKDAFLANHGKDAKVVFTPKSFQWPQAPLPAKAPAFFAAQLKLDHPFILLGGRNLCIDILNGTSTGKSQSSYWYVDAFTSKWAQLSGSTKNFGRGCSFGFQLRASLPPLDGESKIHATAWTRGKGLFSFLMLGESRTSFMGLPLPLDLTSLGAKGCRLSIAPRFFLFGGKSGGDIRGTAVFRIPLPKLPSLANIRIYAQPFVLDPGAGALGLRTGSAQEWTFGKISGPLPCRTLYDSGTKPGPVPKRVRDTAPVILLKN